MSCSVKYCGKQSETRRGETRPETWARGKLRRRTVLVAVELQVVGASASGLKNRDVAEPTGRQ